MYQRNAASSKVPSPIPRTKGCASDASQTGAAAARSDGGDAQAPAGRGSGRVRPLAARLLTRHVVLDLHDVVARALDDAQEVRHRRDLLDLLLDEPLHELLARVVALGAGAAGERVDLRGHAPLLVQRQRDGRDDVLEAHLRRGDAGDDHVGVGVDQVLDHHHRVVALLERLRVEEARELRERLGVVVDRARHVLLVGGIFVSDLLVQQ